jgi:hypothetical protein
VTRRTLALGLGLVASAALVTSASASIPDGPVSSALNQACFATLTSLQTVVYDAAITPVQTIVTQLQLPKPGVVTGRIAFNPSGDEIAVAGDASGRRPGVGVGCSGGSRSLRPGRSYVVSTLRERLKAGTYTLTFDLNARGRRILARLGARQRAYSKHHRHGQQAPTIAVGVGLNYTPSG